MTEQLAQSLPSYPASKKVLVDKYAEIALFDANQNNADIFLSSTQLTATKPR